MAVNRPPVIERLEAKAAVVQKRFTLDQVKSFCQAIRDVTPLVDVAAQCQLSSEEVLDLGAKLGTWLTHAYGSVEAEIVLASKRTQLEMFQDPSGATVVIPMGFERRAKQRRDIAKALATIVVRNPDEATLVRFLDRQYPETTAVMTARDVFVVWTFSRLGRVEELDQVSDSPAYARVTVNAFDLLATAVSDAESAARAACDLNATPEDVLDACAKMRWVNEARVMTIERLARLSHPERCEALRREQKRFAQEISHSPEWCISKVETLREGQVLRIIQSAGLGEVSTRRQEAELRKRLSDLGLARDLDRLVPMGVRATKAGIEDVFWSAMERRAQSEPDWREELDTAFAMAGGPALELVDND